MSRPHPLLKHEVTLTTTRCLPLGEPKQRAVLGTLKRVVQPASQNRFLQQPHFDPGKNDRSGKSDLAYSDRPEGPLSSP
jgi:hypothetical protein